MEEKRNPAPRAAGRALDGFNCLAALNDREIYPPLSNVQASYLARRFQLTPAVAALVAALAYRGGAHV
jgi:hypothetical protein